MINLIKNKILLAIIVVVLIIISSLIWYFVSISHVNKNETEIEITIPLGSGTNKIADILKENKLIKNKMSFKIYVKLNKVSNFQAGTYYLKQSMNVKEITEMLQTGIMHDPNQLSITYIEGKNMRWLANRIEETTNNTQEDVMKTLEDKEYIDSLIDKYWFLTNEINQDEIYYSLEEINLSNINNTEGKTAITIVILIIAPLEINVHSEPIISSFE